MYLESSSIEDQKKWPCPVSDAGEAGAAATAVCLQFLGSSSVLARMKILHNKDGQTQELESRKGLLDS